ncbi:MAG: (Fe-S)-binding protein [Dehalococcoidia bacterium]|nr:(Fe-S)-binding protein [Dehalococcoidia bacterium]
MVALTLFKEAADMIREAGGEKLDNCYQCGLCTGSCPWNQVRSFMVRRLIHQAQLGVIDFESDDLWLCTTCRNCVQRCPRGVEIIDIMRAARRVITETGTSKIPDSLRLAITNIAGAGNPLGQPPEERGDWATSLKLKHHVNSYTLYFSCCIPAYEPKVKRVAMATAQILKVAGVDFNILADKENCCGESVRKAGDENLFRSLANKNLEAFSEAGVKQILVSSPHCYHSFKNEYSKLGAEFEVLHMVQYLAQLISDEKLTFKKEVKKKVAYHDSCYLARHNAIYDEPRQILKSIPGIEIVEMSDIKDNTLCCGGGGGRIWMDTKKDERFSDLRIQQALDAGADVLAVSCPYCMLNFEDSLLGFSDTKPIEIKDVVELICEGLS